ncbi:MAG: HD-GYP domain-containing protein [Butyrivibrio sp.]|nr:HD-GYP domain-containing protein [Butyrivibrio sp.]
MRWRSNKKQIIRLYLAVIGVAVLCMLISLIRTGTYNAKRHTASFSEADLFTAKEPNKKDITVTANVRDSTWTKALDINNEGITEHNFQAYTIDFLIDNGTKNNVKDFTFKLTFNKNTYLISAWNGSLEIHQATDNGEFVDLIPDLREFKPADHAVEIFSSEGENMVTMKPGDYLIYYPSSSVNAVEIPISAHTASTPGFIMYLKIGEKLEDALSLDIEYSFQKKLVSDPFFWISIVLTFIWLVALTIYLLTSMQLKKYKERHERDNVIINDSMNTFISFIDAKDPYTNGHSIRVAKYSRRIAEELGFGKEDLERIYYVALLHDCGKIGIPDNILAKPEKLTDEEFEIIKSHTVRGGAILSNFKSLKNVGEGALYHHERYDGKGYPEGKAGTDIPFIARIICVADSYDAMNSDRVYRKKLSKQRIVEEIRNGKGKQFDPTIADIMLNLIKHNKLDDEPKKDSEET